MLKLLEVPVQGDSAYCCNQLGFRKCAQVCHRSRHWRCADNLVVADAATTSASNATYLIIVAVTQAGASNVVDIVNVAVKKDATAARVVQQSRKCGAHAQCMGQRRRPHGRRGERNREPQRERTKHRRQITSMRRATERTARRERGQQR